MIRRASKKHWQASAWWLERRYPERYGKREVLAIRKLARQLKEMEQRLTTAGVAAAAEEHTAEG